jgi:hypothetical protein
MISNSSFFLPDVSCFHPVDCACKEVGDLNQIKFFGVHILNLLRRNIEQAGVGVASSALLLPLGFSQLSLPALPDRFPDLGQIA